VAVAEGANLLATRRLDETRRHARDLAPAVKELLAGQCWRPRDLSAVIVGLGPGSYTGLRVGLTSAKTLAYATGCALIGVETFAAITRQVGAAWRRLDVLADAQQDKIYVQSYERRDDAGWQASTPLAICAFALWLAHRRPDAAATGPGLRKWADQLPAEVPVVDRPCWEPQVVSLLEIGLARLEAGQRDDPFILEPLYLRPSSAEEQWQARGRA
jgi:tRNA threonylcarbamoyladenosine biosynthesis protein TsaB